MNPSTVPAAAPESERILVVCTQYLGDTLLAIPFLRNLRRAHPAAAIDVCGPPGPRAMLAACPYVDDRIAWTRPPRERRGGLVATATGLAAEAAWLRSRRYTKAYLLKPSFSAAALATLAGIPRRVGFRGESSPLLTTAIRRRVGRHQVETYLDLLRGEGLPVDDGHNENWVPPEAHTRVAPLLAGLPAGRPRVFLAVRSTDPLKLWPLDRWRSLLRWLVDDRGCEAVLCGGPGDRKAHAELLRSCPPSLAAHVHDFSTDVLLADAAALMAEMRLCVGVDTGMVHLAASLGVPAVVIVGPTDPNRWHPWGARSVVLRSSAPRPSLAERLATTVRREPLRFPLGRATPDEVGFEDVRAAVESVGLQAGEPTRIDLTEGEHRYEVIAYSAASPPARAAAVPATKPLAHAH
ncbi:MAG: glycosyltransferase family 9 protein [Planctomycetaceae bacterium]